MAQIADITLVDALAANVVYSPRKASPENSVLASRGYNVNVDTAATDMLLSVGVSPASAKRPTSRIKASMAIPNPEYLVTDTAPLSTARVFLDVIVPDDFSQAARDMVNALLADFFSDAAVADAIKSDEGLY